MDIWERWKRTTIANKGLVFSSILMALGTLFYAGAAIVQICIMKQNARDASVQTDKLIKAAEAQACAAKSFSASAEGIETKTSEAVTHFQHLASAAQQSADVAREALINVQAALITFLGTMTYTKQIDGNKISSLTLTLPLPNIGGTSTVNLKSHINILPFPMTGMPANFTFTDLGPVLMRQGEIPARASGTATMEDVRPEMFVDAEHNRSRIYVWGWVTYNDVFKRTNRHLTEFCDEVTNVKVTNEDALQAPQASSEFSWTLSFCTANHNCYDRQCSDYSEKIKE